MKYRIKKNRVIALGSNDPETIMYYDRLSNKAAKTLVMLWVVADEETGDLPHIRELARLIRCNLEGTHKIMGELINFVELMGNKKMVTPSDEPIKYGLFTDFEFGMIHQMNKDYDHIVEMWGLEV